MRTSRPETAPAVGGGRQGADGALAPDPEFVTSAVDFPTRTRPHVSLNVRNVERSLPFYRVLFGCRPTKLRSDYAKFELEQPPVNFTLNQHPDAVDHHGHFGVQVKSTREVEVTAARFRRLSRSLGSIEVKAQETEVACCFAVQNKVWLVDPDGNHWEVFVVIEDEADQGCGPTCICYDPSTGDCRW